jgi:hypothetical protein
MSDLMLLQQQEHGFASLSSSGSSSIVLLGMRVLLAAVAGRILQRLLARRHKPMLFAVGLDPVLLDNVHARLVQSKAASGRSPGSSVTHCNMHSMENTSCALCITNAHCAALLCPRTSLQDRVETSPEQMAACSALAEHVSSSTGLPTRVVGWYHSHPHITVLPSHVDVNTQVGGLLLYAMLYE